LHRVQWYARRIGWHVSTLNTAVKKGLPTPVTCRLEYLTPEGDWTYLATHALLYPDRYADRLSDAGKVGRAVEVGGDQRIWTSDNVPDDPSVLVPTTEGGPVPYKLPHCTECQAAHADGFCLI
jgi:hypothetical protein